LAIKILPEDLIEGYSVKWLFDEDILALWALQLGDVLLLNVRVQSLARADGLPALVAAEYGLVGSGVANGLKTGLFVWLHIVVYFFQLKHIRNGGCVPCVFDLLFALGGVFTICGDPRNTYGACFAFLCLQHQSGPADNAAD